MLLGAILLVPVPVLVLPAAGGGRGGWRPRRNVMGGPELSLGQQRRPSDVVAEHAPGPSAGLT